MSRTRDPDPFRVSVAMATYNGERYLPEQLESIAAQTLPPAELVVCDDGSTDGTLGVLRQFAERAPFPVRVSRNATPLGFGDNFLRAASLCQSPWVAFCDQDDVWLPRKLAAVVAAAQADGVVLVAHSADLVGEGLAPTGRRLPDLADHTAGPLESRPVGFLWGFTLAFDRSLLDGAPLERRPVDVTEPGRRQSHDQVVPLLANALGSTVHLSDTLALYRRHGGAATGDEASGGYATGLRARAALHVRSSEADYRLRAQIARQAEVFLGETAAAAAPERAGRLTRAARYYGLYADALDRRATVYDRSAGRPGRLAQWARAVSHGLYRQIGAGAGFGWRACAKDLVVGVAG